MDALLQVLPHERGRQVSNTCRPPLSLYDEINHQINQAL